MEILMNIFPNAEQNEISYNRGVGRYGPFFLALKSIFPNRLNQKNRIHTYVSSR